MSNEDSRYPYTYACDLIRAYAGYNTGGTNISRSDASHVRSMIADVIGMDDAELAKMLADYYQANEEAISQKSATELMQSMRI